MKVIITGGAGFIGCNVAHRYLGGGTEVVVFDNLSRKGSDRNLAWLQEAGGKLTFTKGDIRALPDLDAMFRDHTDVDMVVHLAAQVAVTTSVNDPREDFEINALGTFNVLEAVRLARIRPLILYSSTNKVYGEMEDVRVVEDGTRHRYEQQAHGIAETQPMDFHSPYGCSKGAGDQYVRDYSRIYNIPTVVLRQSCIYGCRQLGVEDQGWVAWFLIAAVLGKPITIYGDGKQIRDVLFVDDLVDLYDLCYRRRETCAGQVYNVGGGPDFTLSVWQEFGPMIEALLNRKIPIAQGDWRPGDQKVYVSDIRRVQAELGWVPRVAPKDGVSRLYEWVCANREMLEELF